MRINVTLHQLETFLSVADTGAFRKAAQRLHVSQPALSRTIASAEEALGARLFDRDTRNVRLTSAGEELLPIARRVLTEFESSLGDLGKFIAGHRGRVVVATLPSVGNALLPQAMAEFAKQSPGVDFSIRAMSTRPVLQSVGAGEADLGLCMKPPADPLLHYEHLMDDEFALVCAANHPLARQRRVGWEAFAQHPYIAESNGTSIRMLTENVFRDLGLSVHNAYECENLHLCGQLVATGIGITAMPKLALNQFDLTGLQVKPLRGPTLSRPLGIVTRVGRTSSAAARHFHALLKQQARVAGIANHRLPSGRGQGMQ